MKKPVAKHQITEFIANHINKNCYGKDNLIGSKELIDLIEKEFNVKYSTREIQFHIKDIRLNYLVKNLVGSSNGYFIADSAYELNKYISRLEKIMVETQMLIECMKNGDDGLLDYGKINFESYDGDIDF